MKVLTKALTALLLLYLATQGTALSAAESATVLPDLLNPDSIALDDQQVYVTQGPEIHIYRRDTLKVVAVFGKDGEGPREFRLVPGLPLILNVDGPELMVNSFGKVSYFSKSGQFLRENRTKAGFILMAQPFGNNLACWGLTFEDGTRYRTIDLFDRDLKKLRNLVKVKDDFQAPGLGMDILRASFSFSVLQDRLWVAHSPDFVIHTFDLKGEPAGEIRLEGMPRRDMTPADRDQILEFLRTDKSTREQFNLLKPIRFPSRFPAIMAIFAAQGKMYVMTWQRENGRNEMLVMDPQGKVERTLRLAVAYQNALRPSPFAIRDQQLFQLVENEDEDWELRITPIR